MRRSTPLERCPAIGNLKLKRKTLHEIETCVLITQRIKVRVDIGSLSSFPLPPRERGTMIIF
jgi:hypothetical protein